MAMSKEHKDALAEGRRQGFAVRKYLEWLDRDKKRGPKVSSDRLAEKITELSEAIKAETDPSNKLELIQERLDAEQDLSNRQDEADLDEITNDFTAIAKAYSDRKGISYTAWREMGVPANVLRDAGVPRTRRPNNS